MDLAGQVQRTLRGQIDSSFEYFNIMKVNKGEDYFLSVQQSVLINGSFACYSGAKGCLFLLC